MATIELCGGAFVSTFEKGEKGKPGRWVTVPTFKVPKKKESMKEQPQYALQTTIEKAAVKRYQENLRNQAIDITRYLKTLV